MAPRPATRQLLTLLCVLLLVVRFAGMHLHLCLDGQSPPVSIHWVDVDPDRAGLQVPHHDYDESISAVAASKVSTFGQDGPVLLIAAVLLLALPRLIRIPPPSYAAVYPPLAPSLLRPPVRGPPPLSLA